MQWTRSAPLLTVGGGAWHGEESGDAADHDDTALAGADLGEEALRQTDRAPQVLLPPHPSKDENGEGRRGSEPEARIGCDEWSTRPLLVADAIGRSVWRTLEGLLQAWGGTYHVEDVLHFRDGLFESPPDLSLPYTRTQPTGTEARLVDSEDMWLRAWGDTHHVEDVLHGPVIQCVAPGLEYAPR